jgi:hypothetical protein
MEKQNLYKIFMKCLENPITQPATMDVQCQNAQTPISLEIPANDGEFWHGIKPSKEKQFSPGCAWVGTRDI